jgi:predicted HAD superfamily Cof-like phosphohydrolase
MLDWTAKFSRQLLAYVLFGEAVTAGLPAGNLFAEVHRSNMTKQLDSAGSGMAVKGKS